MEDQGHDPRNHHGRLMKLNPQGGLMAYSRVPSQEEIAKAHQHLYEKMLLEQEKIGGRIGAFNAKK